MKYRPELSPVAVGRWCLDADLVVTAIGYQLRVRAGFVTDLASVPRWVWWIMAPFELSEAAAIVHDWLYAHGGLVQTASGLQLRFDRATADDLLFDIARQDGVWWWRRALAYRAVRWFGARYWEAA